MKEDLEIKLEELKAKWPRGRQGKMATTAKIAKTNKKPKFSTQHRNRCSICGRPRAFLRKFGLCRLCFRGLALKGEIPGVSKSVHGKLVFS